MVLKNNIHTKVSFRTLNSLCQYSFSIPIISYSPHVSLHYYFLSCGSFKTGKSRPVYSNYTITQNCLAFASDEKILKFITWCSQSLCIPKRCRKKNHYLSRDTPHTLRHNVFIIKEKVCTQTQSDIRANSRSVSF